jgi:hypothetical protein
MKTNEKLANIVSTGMALVLCFAILLFALLMIWDIATPAHVHAYPFVTGGSPTPPPFLTSPTASPTVTATATTTTTASVGVDNSSYKVGDSMTVTLSGFPASSTVSLTVQTSGGSNSHSLSSVTTDTTGASTTVHTAPSSPTGTVEIVATDGSITATSSTFTIKKKAATPAPAPAPAPTQPPAPVSYPPAGLVSTPTPVPTATPTAVPTDTPTVAPAPTAVPVVVNHNTAFLGGRLPLALAIGLGVLLALGILFFVGRVLLRRFLSPAPLPDVTPSGAPPWMRSQGDSLQGSTMVNGIPFAQTMPFDSSFPPGNGGVAPGPGNVPQPQPVPFNGPFGPSNGGFAPDNGPFPPGDGGFAPGPANNPQPAPLGSPYQPGNSGFAPTNVPQESFPPNNWFPPPN